MPRVTKSVTAKAKHKKVLNATKGHYGARRRLYKTAKQSNIKSTVPFSQYFRRFWAKIQKSQRNHLPNYCRKFPKA